MQILKAVWICSGSGLTLVTNRSLQHSDSQQSANRKQNFWRFLPFFNTIWEAILTSSRMKN